MKAKIISPCKHCGKETYNTTIDFSGFCSKECEKEYKEGGLK